MSLIETLGLVAAVVLPFWNIPLILRIERRKSSKDMSVWWSVGVWLCLVLMLPSGLATQDLVFRTYSLVNIVLFTAVVVQVLRYRR